MDIYTFVAGLLFLLVVLLLLRKKDSFGLMPVSFQTKHKVEMDRQRRHDEMMSQNSGALYMHQGQDLVF
jgi:hypothetical protein